MEQTSRAPRTRRVLLALIAAFVAGIVCSPLFPRPYYRLQTLSSHDHTHRVELWRFDHLDRNYTVYVDGHKVFGSEDFAPRTDIPFRETLFWDSTGQFVILEIGGHRVFGYDVTAGRRLADSDLLAAKPPPEPSLWEYSSETEWPGIGHVRRPDRRR